MCIVNDQCAEVALELPLVLESEMETRFSRKIERSVVQYQYHYSAMDALVYFLFSQYGNFYLVICCGYRYSQFNNALAGVTIPGMRMPAVVCSRLWVQR